MPIKYTQQEHNQRLQDAATLTAREFINKHKCGIATYFKWRSSARQAGFEVTEFKRPYTPRRTKHKRQGNNYQLLKRTHKGWVTVCVDCDSAIDKT